MDTSSGASKLYLSTGVTILNIGVRMKGLIFSLGVLLLLVPGRICPAESVLRENVVRNGGFEMGKDFPTGWGWAKWSGEPSSATPALTSDRHTGNQAVQLTGLKNVSDKENVRYLIYSYPVEIRNGIHDLDLWFKTTGNASASVTVQYYDRQPTFGRWDLKPFDASSYTIGTSKTWTYFHRRLSIPKNVKYVMILLRATDMGSVFFDDVSFVRQIQPVTASVFPAEFGREGKVCCLADFFTPVYFEFTGDAPKKQVSAWLHVDIPQEVFAACVNPMTVTEQSGRRIVSVDVSQAMEQLQPAFTGHSGAVLWLKTPLGVDGDFLRYHIVYDGGELPSKELKLRVLKGYDGTKLSSRIFPFSFFWSLLLDAPESIWPGVYNLLRTSGINVFTTRPMPLDDPNFPPMFRYLEERFRNDGCLVVASVPHSYGKQKPYGDPDPDQPPRSGAEANWASQIIEMGEKTFEQMDSSTLFLPKGTGALKSCKDRIDAYYWDFEPRNEREQPNLDDPLTLTQFAHWSGRDDKTLNKACIREHCLEEFMTFRAWQIGEVIRIFRRWVKRVAPDIEVWVAAGRELPTVRFVDYRLYDDTDVYHMPMIYTSRVVDWYKTLSNDIRLVPRGKEVFMPTMSNLGDRRHGTYVHNSPGNMRLRFLSAAALGCRGIGHWPDLHRGVDGEYFAEYSRAAWETAAMIDVWKKGKRIDSLFTIEGLPYRTQAFVTPEKTIHEQQPAWKKYLLTFAHQAADGMYMTVLNTYEKEDAFVEIKAPDLTLMRYYVTDPVYKRSIVPNKEQSFWLASQLATEGILINVPAEGAGFVRISTEAPSMEYQDVIVCRELCREYEKRLKASSSAESAVIEGDGIRIDFDDVDGDGVIERCVTTPSQTVWINRNGTIIAWQVRGQKNRLVTPGGAQSAAEDRFWLPKDLYGKTPAAEGEFLAATIEQGVAQATVQEKFSNLALAGVILTKFFKVFADRPGIEVTVDICNQDGLVPIELGYWSANLLGIGLPHANWIYPGPNGIVEFDKHKKKRSLYTHPNDLESEYLKYTEKTSLPPLCGNWCETVDPDNEEKVRLTIDPADLMQLYQWNHKNGMHTMEWMAKPLQLDVGKTSSMRYTLTYSPSKKHPAK